jgi:glycosyltransferase involved in cell wall biosynthesis
MSKSFLQAGIEVEFIDNLKSLSNKPFLFRLRNFIYNNLLKEKFGTYDSFYEPRNLKHIARQVKKRINKTTGGIVFSPGSIAVSYLNINKPIVIWTDATFAVMHNYYEELSFLNKRTIRNCHLYEKKALKKSSLAIFSSEWAAKSSTEDYGTNPKKVKIIPYGANINSTRSINDIIGYNRNKSRKICKLLFVGKDWKRKGAEAAINVAKELNKQNIRTELTILGCHSPLEACLPDYIYTVGFVDKSKKDGELLINNLYSESHFFILPTIAECTPVVFSEANSFGLPVITTNTGGISSVIKNDINGKMFTPDMEISSWALYISKFFKDFGKYEAYSLSSFNEYITTLNWPVSIDKCTRYMKNLGSEELTDIILTTA